MTTTPFTDSPNHDDLRAHVDLFQILAENISDVVSITEGDDGVITWISPSIVAMLGFPPEQMLGHPFVDYIVHEDEPLLNTALEKVLRGETYTFEIRLLHRDQRIRRVVIVSHRVDIAGHDRARIATWRDVSDSRQSRDSLLQLQHDFQLVAENASHVVIQTDVHGTIDWVSPRSPRYWDGEPSTYSANKSSISSPRATPSALARGSPWC